MSLTGFTPIHRVNGYLPIEDYGLIGNGTTAALVGRDGSIGWLCAPRFDSPPLFCPLLDATRGGVFVIAPDEIIEARQRYQDDDAVLVTEMRGRAGLVRVTDLLPLAEDAELSEMRDAGRAELLRMVEVLDGEVNLTIAIEPRGGATAARAESGLVLRAHRQPDLGLCLHATTPLDGPRAVLPLKSGDRFNLRLRWGDTAERRARLEPEEELEWTTRVWRRWLSTFAYHGPQEPLVRRSAITVKLLDYLPTGAIVAAPTSSLPEAIGGPRNWDYRYAWVRDVTYSVHALRRIGLTHEAHDFLTWILSIVEHGQRPRVLYTLDGEQPEPEWEDPDLEGYRQSSPVRWSNGAADQIQHDVYGEILDCAYQWASEERSLGESLWKRLRALVEAARKVWRQPDHGIWEIRADGRLFVHSIAICEVALDRGARLAERFDLDGDVAGWRAEAARIRQAIVEEAWNDEIRAIAGSLGGSSVDASVLSLPMRRVIPANHPRMVATTEAIASRLGAGNGLLYRYLPRESPDGLEGHEGAFLLCSFWLVDNLTLQGRLDEALDLYQSLCARANPLGLLPEQIDPGTGAFLGNFPQAFSHVGMIDSGVQLAHALRRQG